MESAVIAAVTHHGWWTEVCNGSVSFGNGVGWGVEGGGTGMGGGGSAVC